MNRLALPSCPSVFGLSLLGLVASGGLVACGSQQQTGQTSVQSATVNAGQCSTVDVPHPGLKLKAQGDTTARKVELADMNADGRADVAVTAPAYCNAFNSCIYTVYQQGSCPKMLGNLLATNMAPLPSTSHGVKDLLVTQAMSMGHFQLKYVYDGQVLRAAQTRSCYAQAEGNACVECNDWTDVKSDSDLVWPSSPRYANACNKSRAEFEAGQ